MGQTKKHSPVKLFVGFIFKDERALKRAELNLSRRFGKIDFQSGILPFIHTAYYEKEFGKDLKRKFIGFQRLISPEWLARIKIITNKIEEKSAKNQRRLINIDPGYLDLAKVILASTKDYKHRVYMNKGIYAEVTLYFRDEGFKFWEWTYPDYKSAEYIKIFNQMREIYVRQTKNK